MKLTIFAASGRQYVPALRRRLRMAHRMLRPPLVELSLAIVGRREMAILHKRFLGKNGPTDVMTFELEHDRRGRIVSGEVVICLAVARDRARRLGHPMGNELLLYALHGLLHLCGFDDKTAGDFSVMHAKEDEILTRLGIGPVFRPKRTRPTGAG